MFSTFYKLKLKKLSNFDCKSFYKKNKNTKIIYFEFHRRFILVILSIIAFSLTFNAQEKSCNLTIKDSPSLRGVKLGMTPLEISKKWGIKIIPKIELQSFIVYNKNFLDKISIDSKRTIFNKKLVDESNPVSKLLLKEKGKVFNDHKYIDIYLPEVKAFSFFPIELSSFNQKALEGVGNVELKFYLNQLYSVKIFYETNVYASSTSKELVLSLAESLNLPEKCWKIPIDNPTDKNRVGFVECTNFKVYALFDESFGSIDISNLNTELIINDSILNSAEKMYLDLERTMKKNREFRP